jgi:hypothetical protein
MMNLKKIMNIEKDCKGCHLSDCSFIKLYIEDSRNNSKGFLINLQQKNTFRKQKNIRKNEGRLF